jgi:hypothetical protein
MKTLTLALTGILMVGLTASQLHAQTRDRAGVEREQKAPDQVGHDKPDSPSASPETTGPEQTGGDSRPNAVDPAQADKTGANVGDGASYSRSSEKGESTVDGTERK